MVSQRYATILFYTGTVLLLILLTTRLTATAERQPGETRHTLERREIERVRFGKERVGELEIFFRAW